jgi:putative membrane protein
MFYDNNYWGMNIIWWVIWVFLLIWIFAIPYDIPGQRLRRDSPLDILQRRFVSGEITEGQYKELKQELEKETLFR